MTLVRNPAIVVICTCAFSLSASATLAPQNLVSQSNVSQGNVSQGNVAQNTNTQDDLDRSIKPGDDFYHYANGGWLKATAIPAGQPSYDSRAMITEKTAQRVSNLIQEAAATHAANGSTAQKVGDYYASFMDEAVIESKGLTPLADEMNKIAAITNKTSLSAYLGSTLNSEVDGLTANADHIFGVWINQGFQDSQHNLPHIWQGGLGLPDRDSYLDPSPKATELRTQYQTHIAAILKLAGVADSETKAAQILSLEVKIAQSHASDSDAADVSKQNNPWKRRDFAAKAPGIDWNAYFASAGLATQTDFLVWQPSAVTGTSALVDTESVEAWKDYLRFHLIEHYSAVLPKAIAAEDFAFYGKILGGAEQPADRSKAAIAATNAALGQAVGQLIRNIISRPQPKPKRKPWLTTFSSRIAHASPISRGCLLKPGKKPWPSWPHSK
jgi:putative endopeptidase